MLVARLRHLGEPRWAVVDQGQYHLMTSSEPWNDPSVESVSHSFDPGLLMAPAIPSKIIGIGLNYTDHALEMKMQAPDEPVMFLKPTSALLDPGGIIVRPAASKRVDHEAELAIVMKKRTKNASLEEAKEAIWGYTCCNDVTARDLQKKDGQWGRAKGFDTFCPLGPWINTAFEARSQNILCRVNGKMVQKSKVSNMIFDPVRLVAFVSRVMTLEPLDVITTGTPAGIGPLQSGDVVDVYIEDIGCLVNQVQ